MGKQKRGILVRLILSVVLLVLLFSRIEVDHFLSDLRHVNIAYFAIGLAIFWSYLVLWAYRWQLFLYGAGETIKLGEIFQTLLIGFFFSMFLPTVVGTDAGRMYELSRERENKTGVVSTVLLDRVVGLISTVIMASLALFIGGYRYIDNLIIPVVIVGSLLLLVVGWVLFFNRSFMHRFDWVIRLSIINRFQHSIRSLYQALYLLQQQPRLLITTLLVSFVMQTMEIMSVVLLAVALGLKINVIHFFIFMPIIWILITIPISIGGLGVREGAFVFFLGQVGIGSSHAITVSLLYYFYSVIVGVVGGIIWFRTSITGYFAKDDSLSVG
jgi:glycosyltransferase 2 family protein